MICIINNVWPGKLRLREHDCLPAVHLVNDKKKKGGQDPTCCYTSIKKREITGDLRHCARELCIVQSITCRSMISLANKLVAVL